MTSEVSTVGPPHTLLQVNGSFVNDASDKTEPPLPSDIVIQRCSQLGVPSLCQLDISSPVRYGVLIGNMIRMPAAWLHLLQWMLPWPRAQKLTEMGLDLQGWTRDNTSSQHRGWAAAQRRAHIPSLLQSWELTCAPVQYPCPSHRAWSTGLKHTGWVGAHPLH